MGYSTLAVCQYASSVLGIYKEDGAADWIVLLSITKGNFLYFAVGLQTFEWFNTYRQIMFQDQEHIDITTVVVYKRHFQKREKIYSTVLLWIISVYFFLNIVLVVPLFLKWEKYTFLDIQTPVDKDNAIYMVRVFSLTFALVINLVFMLVTLLLFSCTAYKKHRTAFLEYRFALFIQVAGTIVLLGINLYQNYF